MSIWAIRWKWIRVKLRRGDCLQVSWDDERKGEEKRREENRGKEKRREEMRIEERRGEEGRGEERRSSL